MKQEIPDRSPWVITTMRWAATLFFVVAGALHFVIPDFYLAMMPQFIPMKEPLIILTGLAEIALGIGLQIAVVRRYSGILLIALLIGIFPANIYVAVAQPALPDLTYDPASMWWRLLLQPLFIIWVWWVSVKKQL
ncbi:MAG: DoxX family protein [Bacteroidota bacterium]